MNNDFEMIKCNRCGELFEACNGDLGSYWHDACYPHSRIEHIDTTKLKGIMLEIYMDALRRKYASIRSRTTREESNG